jgi:hypothetical protein
VLFRSTTIIEKRGSGGTVVIAVLLLAIVAIAAYFLVTNDHRRTDAVTDAAQSVGRTADTAGDAIKDGVKTPAD